MIDRGLYNYLYIVMTPYIKRYNIILKPLQLEVWKCVIKLLLPLDEDTDDIFALCQMVFIQQIFFMVPYVTPNKLS